MVAIVGMTNDGEGTVAFLRAGKDSVPARALWGSGARDSPSKEDRAVSVSIEDCDPAPSKDAGLGGSSDTDRPRPVLRGMLFGDSEPKKEFGIRQCKVQQIAHMRQIHCFIG